MLVGEKKCNCCGHAERIYRYFLDDLDVATLLKVWQAVIEQGKNDIKIQDLDMTNAMMCRTTQLRYFALLQKVKNEKGKHKSGRWLITKRGGDFLHGRISIPYYVWTINNHVVPREDVMKITGELLKQPSADELNKQVNRSNYKVLESFKASYEIVGSKPIKINITQLNLFF